MLQVLCDCGAARTKHPTCNAVYGVSMAFLKRREPVPQVLAGERSQMTYEYFGAGETKPVMLYHRYDTGMWYWVWNARIISQPFGTEQDARTSKASVQWTSGQTVEHLIPKYNETWHPIS